MDERKNKITSGQLMIFILSAQTGIGILSLPSILAQRAGHDGWISVILTGVAVIIFAVIVIKLLQRYNDKSIFDINMLLYGKYIGIILNFLLFFDVFYRTIINTRIFTEVIKVLVLKLTPSVILTFFLLIPTVYLSWYGLKPICRFAEQLLVIMFIVFLLFLLVVKFSRIDFLLPVGEAGISSILQGIPRTAYSLVGFALTLIIYPEITDKKNAMKNVIGALLITVSFFTLVVAFTTSFFGEVLVSRLVFPLFSVSRSYRAPVFERIDFFFLIAWFPAMAMAVRAYFFTTYYSVRKLLTLKRDLLPLLLLTIVVIILSRIPRDFAHIQFFIDISNKIGIPLAFTVVIADYLLSFVNKKGVQKK